MKVLKEICEFTGHNSYTDEQLEKLRDHLKIDNMRKMAVDIATTEKDRVMNERFFRKGKVGDWKNHLSEERQAMFDTWIKKNLEGTDIQMTFE